MKSEVQRIFISDLPETLTRDELDSRFSNYGQVSSIEIKERKELGIKNKSLFFAYINLVTNHSELNKCFKDISSEKWHGQYLQLQIARESFLDRLKREREENQVQNNTVVDNSTVVELNTPLKQNSANNTKETTIDRNLSDSGSESTLHIENEEFKQTSVKLSTETKIDPDFDVDVVIKNNKNKHLDKNGLKIPSVGKEPIMKITKSKHKTTGNDSESNLKRLLSLQNMKKGYNDQKNFIRKALSNADRKPNKKIVFDEDLEVNAKVMQNDTEQRSLFDSDSESDDEYAVENKFKIKEQFQGKSGQKLLELQSKYKNDRRFMLDERFIDDEKEYDSMEREDASEERLEAEKNIQFKILEQVIGKKIKKEQSTEGKSDSMKKKIMRRFDPTRSNHTDFEIKEPEKRIKIKEKLKAVETEMDESKEPEVSKEVFYRVTNNLKDTFEDKEQFSLLGTFGKPDTDADEEDQGTSELKLNSHSLSKSKNPFKYDSSEEEDETEDIPHKSQTGTQSKSSDTNVNKTSKVLFWAEPFFFKNDDYRLQEGMDFIQKIKGENREFDKFRRELKGIVKAKVRNNERKNKMFKKKLGGSRKRKQIRLKKALKR